MAKGSDTMFKMFAGIGTIALTIAITLGIASAQTDTAQPSRNDPPPAAPNLTSKDTVPPATDPSLPTRGGKQEPSSKVEGTEANAAILNNGVLTVQGAPQDSQTAPAKFSKRTDEADKLPIAAYALNQLSGQQRERLHSVLHKQMALSGEQLGGLAEVGAEVPASVTLKDLEPLPEQLVSEFPVLKPLAFTRFGDKIVLVDPVLHRVLAVVN
jgi:hypothetical protein